VVDAAYHRSGPVSRCYDGTREDVIAEIIQWVDEDDHPICWLKGPAGSGKSAISQAIAEQCAAKGRLAGSFFFFRGAGDRSTIARLIPTLSHQLSTSVPGTKPLIQSVIESEPHVTHQSLRHQFQKLVIEPTIRHKPANRFMTKLTRRKSVTTVIVLDALDECNDKDLVMEFIDIVIVAFKENHGLPLRLFITSRVEEHVRQKLETPAAQSAVHCLSLQDFDARPDIIKFFRSCFAAIYAENPRVMRSISLPWPTESDLDFLVGKSDGSFIFAATLMDFIRSGSGLPQDKLQKALTAEAGLDALYKQVLLDAPRDENFERVIGTVILLRTSLSITFLAHLLRLRAEDVVQALLGTQSIIMIPGDDDQPIQLFHTSLRDFLVAQPRSGEFFIDPPTRHFCIAINCMTVILMQPEQGIFFGRQQKYSCFNWCYHIYEGLISGGKYVCDALSCTSLVKYLEDFASQSLHFWVNTLLLYDSDQELDMLDSLLLVLNVSNMFSTLNNLTNLPLAISDLPTRSGASLEKH
jgi:cytidylate kinase